MKNLLNKDERCDTILLTVRWNCMNNNVLISTSILNSLWETERKDTIDTLLPFLKYSIAKITKVNDLIDISKSTEIMMEEFGFDTFPSNLVKVMLNRLRSKEVKKEDGKYYLRTSLCDEIDKLERKRTIYKEHSEKVAVALTSYLNDNYKIRSFNNDTALKALIEFFVAKGICIVKDADMLKLISRSDDKLNYCIAQFIIDEKEKDSTVFSYIVDMVKGFFISSAIYIQPQNESVAKAKFKNLHCYIDTGIVLCALGLKTEEEKKASRELLDMLRKEGAQLCIFRHNIEEIYDIILAYKSSLEDPRNNRSSHTLEYFDKLQYKASHVERYLSGLETKIKCLNIEPENTPEYGDYTIDEKGFTDTLKDKITYRKDIALTRDVDSVSAIYRLRKNNFVDNIERCNHIFVTSNIKLVTETNRFFSDEIKDKVPLVILDINLSAIAWLKSYSTNKDYPKNKLIENAVSSIEPSAQLIYAFFDSIDKMKSEGQITDDEAAIYRTNLFCKRELTKATQGDPSSINENMLHNIFEKFKSDLSSKERSISYENHKKYEKEHEGKLSIVRNAVDEIDEIGYKTERINVVIGYIVSVLVLSGILAFGVIYLILDLLAECKLNGVGIALIILSLFDIAGFVDLVFGKVGVFKNIINRFAKWRRDVRTDKKRAEYKKILGNSFMDELN